jgi:K+ potassium transporter
MADGALTPAVSITSAVGGIGVAKPEVTKDIIPISIVRKQNLRQRPQCLSEPCIQAFILALFLAQRVGTARLGFAFGPGECTTLRLSPSVRANPLQSVFHLVPPPRWNGYLQHHQLSRHLSSV